MLGSYTQVFTVYNDWRKFSVFLIWKIHNSSQQLTRTFAQLLAIPWRRNISRNLTTKKIGMKLLTCPFPDGILPITSSNEWTNRKRIVNPNPAYAGSCYHDYKGNKYISTCRSQSLKYNTQNYKQGRFQVLFVS